MRMTLAAENATGRHSSGDYIEELDCLAIRRSSPIILQII